MSRLPHPSSRRGFSLVLSLTIMAMMVMVVIVLAAFLSVESKLAKAAQYRTQSKLHALVSLRLALAHLQQEAGPDRRMTAQANLGANSNQPGWNWQTIRNPLWTGVWRSDRPTQPPAWLVSGRHDRPANSQSVNLFGKTDYEADHWVPFQTDYAPTAGPMMITLVGDATGLPAELMNWPTTPGRPDGRIYLPKVPLPDANVAGSYCYWIGDEGVKAKLNLTDTRLTPPAGTTVSADQQTYNQVMALRGTGRTGIEILKGFENIPLGGIDSRATKLSDLNLLDPGAFTETTPPTIARKAWPSLTMVSRGLNTDSQWGGLKIDLSIAFEKTDAEFKASEFGEGPPPKDSLGNALSGVTYTFNPKGTINRAAYGDAKVDVKYDGTPFGGTNGSHLISPLYSYTFNNTTVRGSHLGSPAQLPSALQGSRVERLHQPYREFADPARADALPEHHQSEEFLRRDGPLRPHVQPHGHVRGRLCLEQPAPPTDESGGHAVCRPRDAGLGPAEQWRHPPLDALPDHRPAQPLQRRHAAQARKHERHGGDAPLLPRLVGVVDGLRPHRRQRGEHLVLGHAHLGPVHRFLPQLGREFPYVHPRNHPAAR
jgi:hypothetical protein